MKKRIAIFASGSGTNAEAIIDHFKQSEIGEISLILGNNKEAYVFERAKNHNIPWAAFNSDEFYRDTKVDELLEAHQIDFIVLAGFMWLFPKRLVRKFENKIVNIHPALLPNYGGKGMFGMHVHNAVVAAGEKETGITIHYVNEKYDEGQVIFQAKVPVEANDTPDEVANKVHSLEYAHFPRIIEQCLL